MDSIIGTLTGPAAALLVIPAIATGVSAIRNPGWVISGKGIVRLGLIALGTLAGGVAGTFTGVALGAAGVGVGLACSSNAIISLGVYLGFLLGLSGYVSGNMLGAQATYRRLAARAKATGVPAVALSPFLS